MLKHISIRVKACVVNMIFRYICNIWYEPTTLYHMMFRIFMIKYVQVIQYDSYHNLALWFTSKIQTGTLTMAAEFENILFWWQNWDVGDFTLKGLDDFFNEKWIRKHNKGGRTLNLKLERKIIWSHLRSFHVILIVFGGSNMIQ